MEADQGSGGRTAAPVPAHPPPCRHPHGLVRGAGRQAGRDDVAVRRATGWIAICTVTLVPGSGVTDGSTLAESGSVPGVSAHSSAALAHETDGSDPSTHAYGEHPDQQITVHPARGSKRAAPPPAILLLHGGYWAYRATWHTLPQSLARQGFVVLDAGYALSPRAQWPAQFNDVRHALDWSIAHADEFGFDPDRVLVLGSSAGGQLAALLGTHPAGRNRVRGVIALSPVVSPYRAWLDGGRDSANLRQQRLRIATEELVGCAPDRSDAACWRRWRSTEVKSHAGGTSAPMLLVHSAGDYVPDAPSRELAQALPDAELAVVPGSGHGRGLLAVPGVTAELVAWARKVLK